MSMLTRTDEAKSALAAGWRRNRVYNQPTGGVGPNTPDRVASPGISYYLGLISVKITTLWLPTALAFNENFPVDVWVWGQNDAGGADEQDILIASPTPANPEVTYYFDAPLPVVNNEGTPAQLWYGYYTPPSFMTAIRMHFDWQLIPDPAWKDADWSDSTPAMP